MRKGNKLENALQRIDFENDKQVEYCTLLTRGKQKLVYVYLLPGWCEADGGQHMTEFFISPPKDGSELLLSTSFNQKLTEQRTLLRRCYCIDCTTNVDDPRYSREDAMRELVRHRMVVARANSIPCDGAPENEAKLDAILRGET